MSVKPQNCQYTTVLSGLKRLIRSCIKMDFGWLFALGSGNINGCYHRHPYSPYVLQELFWNLNFSISIQNSDLKFHTPLNSLDSGICTNPRHVYANFLRELSARPHGLSTRFQKATGIMMTFIFSGHFPFAFPVIFPVAQRLYKIRFGNRFYFPSSIPSINGSVH